MDGSAEGVVEAGSAGPDAMHEDLVELWHFGPEDLEADVAFLLGGGHVGSWGWRGW
jgi:hypothetical protein